MSYLNIYIYISPQAALGDYNYERVFPCRGCNWDHMSGP